MENLQKNSSSSKESANIQQQKSWNILLIGESSKDIYEYGNCERLSPEAPIPVFKQLKTQIIFGMGKNVYNNLISFGCKCFFATNKPDQIIKRRFLDEKSMYQIMRQDIEEKVSLDSTDFLKKLNNYDAIVISDYNKGLLTDGIIQSITKNFKGPIFVDSKRKDLTLYKKAIIKINEIESRSAKINKECELIVTCGKRGANYKGLNYPAPKVNVYDVTGAGDVFLASLCYFYLELGSIELSIPKCIYLASKSVNKIGSYIISKKDIYEIYN